MVVIVRCKDNSCSVALESCLDGLIREGLISAYLDRGEWVVVPEGVRVNRLRSTRRPVADRIMSAVA